MSSPKFTIKSVHIPKRVLIAGKWWKLQPYSPKEAKRYNKGGSVRYGETLYNAKLIKYLPVLHKEELLDTLAHEGLHAIRAERSLMRDSEDEEEATVVLQTSDFMTYLKQVANIELKC